MSQSTLSDRPYVNSNLFSGHYLDERVKERDEWDCDDEAHEVLDELHSLYKLEGGLVKGYGEDALIDNWIDEVLDALGFGTQAEATLPESGGFVDSLLFESETARRDAAMVYLDTQDTTDLFERSIGLVEAKQWDADFSKRFSEQRPYRNASHQIKHYLERTPENIQWGILTNGRKWRLYGTKDYETQTYYEVDLPELLQRGDLDAFKYFYVFFRPSAFRKSAGTTFIDTVWDESETAAQKLGEDLQDNVFTALRVMGRGFVETNDLGINPNDEENLDELKDQSLVLLYRLMFVLYAEARGLIHPERGGAKDEYEENFSLNALRQQIHNTIGEVDNGFEDEFSEHSTGMWSRLQDLFRLIDEGEESLGIPPYNGGLFNPEAHTFLTEHEVSNRYLAEVIYRLSTTPNNEGRYVLADYADLDTRHLGSVYEGLLEHQFRIAPEQYAAVAEDGGQVWKPATEVSVANAVETVPEGGLYVVNDEGERKSTGAYYTPDYVVTYIVEETVGPLVEEIRNDLIDQGFEPGTQEYLGPFLRRVTDLKILDPAMGSGHFLTKATAFLAEQVMEEVREVETEMGVAFNEQHVRREIAKECIYGVDLNGMAVELAKLSMWLETLAADRPLAFLDHHLKQGNSLAGSDIESIEELESDVSGDDEQYSLAQFGATREGTIERLMDIYDEFLALENETIGDIREMKRKYAEIEKDELRQRLVAMANVHTAEWFGLEIPGGAYERIAKALEDDVKWQSVEQLDWFDKAQSMAEEQDFFHWKLAFPEVFYEPDGSLGDQIGFDTVIGNPPYIKIQEIPEDQKFAYSYRYQTTTQRYDLYSLFVERGHFLSTGHLGYILPNKFFKSNAGSGLRNYLVESGDLRKIVDFGQNQVFDNASTYTCLLFLSKKVKQQGVEYSSVYPILNDIRHSNTISTEVSPDKKWTLRSEDEQLVLDKIEQTGYDISELTKQIFVGIQTSADKIYVLRDVVENGAVVTGESKASDRRINIESDIVEPFVGGDDISRYGGVSTDRCIIYPYDKDGNVYPENELKERFPKAYDYLREYKSDLIDRGSEGHIYKPWYVHWRPRSPEQFKRDKILIPDIAKEGAATYDSEGEVFHSTTVYSPIFESQYQEYKKPVLAILNSKLIWYYIKRTGTVLRGGYYRYKTDYLNPISVPEDATKENLSELVDEVLDTTSELNSINQSLRDYLGNYREGGPLSEVGFIQPPKGSSDSILRQTTQEKPNLRVGKATVSRESTETVEISLTARYKPEGESAYKTDQWGYTETDPLPALHISNLSETEANLIEAFIPVAVKTAGGFANFRETATKTNSLIDRLEAITLPNVDDIAEELNRYREAMERVDVLSKNIRIINGRIDEAVYDLYGLTDEEVDIVETVVDEE